jgi:hypothetical protein
MIIMVGSPVIITSKTRTYYPHGVNFLKQPIGWTGKVTELNETHITVIPLDVDKWFPNEPEITSISLTFDLTTVDVKYMDKQPERKEATI